MQLQVISRADHPISRKDIDPDAIKVLYRLYRAGHTAYLVGGGVRDMLLGRSPKDFDVATSARPSQIKKLFKRGCHLVGRRFRLAHVRFGRDKIIEVSTFRRQPDIEAGDRENDTDDGYISSDNTFGTPQQDALRRDFTINSMFYNIADFALYDYCGGMRDLQDRVIRTIGDPQVRFREDPVRMIRAIKFCARLDFRMDAATWQGIQDNCAAIANASVARVQEEIRRLLESHCAQRSFALLDESGLLAEMIPEIDSYLSRASVGKVAIDPEGALLWDLLHSLDDDLDSLADREERRNLALHALILPLILEVSGDDFTEQSELNAKVISALSARLGICNRVRYAMKQVLSMVLRMLRGKPERRDNHIFGKESFAVAYKLLGMLVQAGVAEPDALSLWKGTDEGQSGKKRSVKTDGAQAGVIKKSNRSRGGKRHSKTKRTAMNAAAIV